jgi:hypothetical protein
MAASDDQESNFDPRRKLCPDGSCVGIIGSDGKCTVCGTADPGGDAEVAATPWDREDDQNEASEVAPSEESLGTESSATGFDPNRRLCSDDACIGVIGKDNRCSECGRAANG